MNYRCCRKAISCFAIAAILAGLALVGASVYLYLNVDTMSGAVQCVVDEMVALDNVSGVGHDNAQTLPVDQIERFQRYVGYLPLSVMVPATLCLFFMLVSSACSVRPWPKGTYCSAKLFSFLAHFLLLLSIIFYGIFAGASFAIKQPRVQVELDVVTQTCNETLPELREQLATAKVDLLRYEVATSFPNPGRRLTEIAPSCDDEDLQGFKDEKDFTCKEWEGFNCNDAVDVYEYTSAGMADVLENCPVCCDRGGEECSTEECYRESVDNAEKALEHFEQICTCVDDFFDSCSDVAIPGLICLGVGLVALLMLDTLCCATGCCCVNRAVVKPASNYAGQGQANPTRDVKGGAVSV